MTEPAPEAPLARVVEKLEAHAERLRALVHRADPATDRVLHSIESTTTWTPAIVAGALIAVFCAGVWLGAKL